MFDFGTDTEKESKIPTINPRLLPHTRVVVGIPRALSKDT